MSRPIKVLPGSPTPLSRDSPVDQRIGISLAVQGFDGGVYFAIESFGIGECLMGQMMRLEIVPDNLDIVELGRVLGQPLDGQPVLARIERRQGNLADMDRPVVLDQHDGFCHPPGLGAVDAVELLQMRNEIAAALGPAGMHDEPAFCMIERAHHGHLLGLPRRRHAQIGAALGPRTRQIGVRQRLAFVAVEQHDIASLGLGLAQLEPQANALDLSGDLAPLQRVPWPPPPEVFFRSALESCDGPISTCSRFLISAMRRGSVQFARLATGALSKGTQTRSAASVFTGAGPAYTLAFTASTPPCVKSLRHSRTVSSRTRNTSAIRALVQPSSVNSMARARSASPRSRDPARASSAARCPSLAVTGDLPAMSRPRESVRRRNHNRDLLVKFMESA